MVYATILNSGQFSTLPAPVTSFLGRHVHFTCGVDAPGILTWEVDGLRARSLQARNITFSTERTGMSETSVLSVATTVSNNNSEITCISRYFNGTEIARSPPAFLYIQGR